MADPALPRRAPTRRAARVRAAFAPLRAGLAQFADHATRPFSGPGLPNWYVYGTFVLLCVCVLSVVLNIALLSLILIAVYG